jgi:hypothetical protein
VNFPGSQDTVAILASRLFSVKVHMKILLAFTPFHTPASPPFGLACLKAAVETAHPQVQVRTVDWNLAFFRRWLLGEMPDLCSFHPTHLVGTVCPSLLVGNGVGEMILADLTRTPSTAHEQDRYIQAARLLDGVFSHLASFYTDLLFSVVERRTSLSDEASDAIFGAELARIGSDQPDLVGFSILSEQNLSYSLALSRVIKERFDIPIALGGAMMSHLGVEELLNGFPWLDFIFFGEAEQSLGDFVNAWPGGDLSDVQGMAHRDGETLSVHGRASHIALDSLPVPDFSDYPLADYITPETVLPMITSRGCYWGKCTFCSHTLPYGGGVRFRAPDQVVDEMVHQMERYGVRYFLFVDEAISPRMLRRLTQVIIDRGLNVRFGTEGVRVESAFDESLLQQAHDAGLRWLYVGIESGNQRLLDLIEKGIDIETTARFIERCRRVGITPQLSFIVGLPSTTVEELQGEIDFMKQHPMDASSYVLLLGSPMHERPEEFGIRIENQQVLYLTPDGPVHAPRFHFTITDGLSPVQADVMVEAAGPMRKMRPHLGEVHAVVLADTDFFTSETRPPAPASTSAIGLQALSQQRSQGVSGARWVLHTLGVLESQGRLQEALKIASATLGGSIPFDDTENCGKGGGRDELRLHAAAILNQLEQPRQALHILSPAKVDSLKSLPVLRAERMRALVAQGEYVQAVDEILALLDAGFEPPWVYYILGLCYEQAGEPECSLKALAVAEQRNWLEPEINEAESRCLHLLRRKPVARKAKALARRKRRLLGQESV